MAKHRMSTADAAWLHMDRPSNLMVVNSVLWFDEALDPADLRDVFALRIVGEFPRFSQRVVDGPTGPHWEDDEDFDIDLHLHRLALPAPHDRVALQDLVSDLIVHPLDRSRPLWDVYLIEEYGSGCAVLVRMHHCIADGIALARVLLSITDEQDATGTPFDDEPEEAPALVLPLTAPLRTAGHAAEVAVQAAAGAARGARHPRQTLSGVLDDARVLAKLLLPGHDTPSPLKGDLHVAHRVAWCEPVQLWRIKATGHALGATVNDVIVAAVAGAVRAYFAEHGDEPLPVHAMVPFNLRPLDRPLPRELGNAFGLVLLGLPVDVEDPLERVHAAKAEMDRIKGSHEGPIAYGILEAMGRTPVQLEELLIDFFTAKGTMVLTNVPGPRRAVTLAGTPVKGVLGWAPASGSVSMSVSVFSYDGGVTVGFLTDAGLVPDPQALADAFRDELLAIGRAARRVPAAQA
jgi:diacylglycerol O-acyltransferase / wax synthase